MRRTTRTTTTLLHYTHVCVLTYPGTHVLSGPLPNQYTSHGYGRKKKMPEVISKVWCLWGSSLSLPALLALLELFGQLGFMYGTISASEK